VAKIISVVNLVEPLLRPCHKRLEKSLAKGMGVRYAKFSLRASGRLLRFMP
jgi:hypothetical protein